jgi:hypothetical protein
MPEEKAEEYSMYANCNSQDKTSDYNDSDDDSQQKLNQTINYLNTLDDQKTNRLNLEESIVKNTKNE